MATNCLLLSKSNDRDLLLFFLGEFQFFIDLMPIDVLISVHFIFLHET